MPSLATRLTCRMDGDDPFAKAAEGAARLLRGRLSRSIATNNAIKVLGSLSEENRHNTLIGDCGRKPLKGNDLPVCIAILAGWPLEFARVKSLTKSAHRSP